MGRFWEIWGYFVEHILDPMGRLFDCFRFKDEPRPARRTSPVQDWDHLLSDYSIFPLLPDPGEFVFAEDLETGRLRSAYCDDVREVEVTDLAEQAQLLKAWGVLFQSPVELKKNRENTRIVNVQDIPSEISSRLSGGECDRGSPIDEIPTEERTVSLIEDKTDKASDLPVELQMEPGEMQVEEKTVSVSEGKSAFSGDVIGSSTPKGLDQWRRKVQNRSVRFECDASPASNQSGGSNSGESQFGSPGDSNGVPLPGRGHSPYPTPLVLSSEMQTPGTVFASAKMVHGAAGKSAKVRSQYVYPIEDFSQFTVLKEAGPGLGVDV